MPAQTNLEDFRTRVFERGLDLYRNLPWRRTQNAYQIWISEVMLQQTQVSRVDGRWQKWLEHFPTVEALASASNVDVLNEWQGMGYNRRALALKQAAEIVTSEYSGAFPTEVSALKALPGIGPATAAGIRAFAYDLPGVYLETNVRTVFLHELMPDAIDVPDRVLIPLVEASCPAEPLTINGETCSPRSWYYALLDYGAYLKKTLPNPSRRSKTHTKQSRFEGSHRQKRAEVVRILLAAPQGLSVDAVAQALNETELSAGREPVLTAFVQDLLEELARENFCHKENGLWTP